MTLKILIGAGLKSLLFFLFPYPPSPLYLLLMLVDTNEEEYAGDYQNQHKKAFVADRQSYIVVIDIQCPVYSDIMQRQPVITAELQCIRRKVKEQQRKQ